MSHPVTMKRSIPSLAFVALVLLGVLVFQFTKITELQSDLRAFSSDRDEVRAELRRLKSRMASLEQTPASAAKKSPDVPPRSPTPAAPPPTAESAATPGVTLTAPAGWWKNGRNSDKYVVGVDTVQTWGGMPSAYVKSVGDAKDGFGGMMQTAAADNYIGKRVRLNAWVKTEEANDGGGHLWLRIDGQERGHTLGFDNMDNRAVTGSNDWQEASVVLEVPPGSSALAYGFFVQGSGKMWVSGQTIQEVGPEVPTTNMLKPKAGLPKSPANLGFDPNRPK
jgi:hypothetical protein